MALPLTIFPFWSIYRTTGFIFSLQRGAVASPTTPEELQAYVKSELAKWTPIIQAAGIKAD
jgi:hypothetical protein